MRHILSRIRRRHGRRPSARPGFTLIEVIVAIAMIAILVGALGTQVLAKINEARINRAVRETMAVEQGVASWVERTGATNYSSVSIGALSSAGAIPSALAASTANPWSGAYAVTGTTTNFTITVSSVPNSTVANAIGGPFSSRATLGVPSTYPGTLSLTFSDQ